jgi:hypothetical protein
MALRLQATTLGAVSAMVPARSGTVTAVNQINQSIIEAHSSQSDKHTYHQNNSFVINGNLCQRSGKREVSVMEQ